LRVGGEGRRKVIEERGKGKGWKEGKGGKRGWKEWELGLGREW
jgi:hypothetical protein